MSAFIPQSLYICIVDAVYTFYSWERERKRERERERLNELPKLNLQITCTFVLIVFYNLIGFLLS